MVCPPPFTSMRLLTVLRHSPATQHDVPSSQDEEASQLLGEKAQSRKTVRTTSTQGDKEDYTSVEYTEIVEHCPDVTCPVLRFVW